jgi:hypothetical protein
MARWKEAILGELQRGHCNDMVEAPWLGCHSSDVGLRFFRMGSSKLGGGCSHDCLLDSGASTETGPIHFAAYLGYGSILLDLMMAFC